MCHYDSGTKDVQKRQTDQVKTMKKTKFDSGQKSQSKKSKKNNGYDI